MNSKYILIVCLLLLFGGCTDKNACVKNGNKYECPSNEKAEYSLNDFDVIELRMHMAQVEDLLGYPTNSSGNANPIHGYKLNDGGYMLLYFVYNKLDNMRIVSPDGREYELVK